MLVHVSKIPGNLYDFAVEHCVPKIPEPRQRWPPDPSYAEVVALNSNYIQIHYNIDWLAKLTMLDA